MDTIQKPKMSPKDFFIFLSILVSLYIFVVGLLTFIFSVIDSAFPDLLSGGYDPYSSVLRLNVSILIIIFPVFLVLLNIMYKQLVNFPEKRDLAIRKWFIYLNMFLTGLAVVIDLVVLLNTFLGGEISTRFILKVLAVLIVTGGVFISSLNDLKNKAFENKKLFTYSQYVLSGILIALIITGFFIMGSPNKIRNLKEDSQRVSDLQSIQYRVVSYFQSKGKLPSQISDLNDNLNGAIPMDPVTGKAYEYSLNTGTTTSFKICATFAEKSVSTTNLYSPDMSYVHDEGRVCFDKNIDSDLYPVRKGGLNNLVAPTVPVQN